MKVADFITEFRDIVKDNEVPQFWSSENIVRYLNEAVQEACERAKLIEDRTTPAVCSITLQAGESTYAIHPSVFEIKRLAFRGKPLAETSVEGLDGNCPGGSICPVQSDISSLPCVTCALCALRSTLLSSQEVAARSAYARSKPG